VQLRDDVLYWFDKNSSGKSSQTNEPDTSFTRKLIARVLGIFPIESQL
jgi:hypothetical protein